MKQRGVDKILNWYNIIQKRAEAQLLFVYQVNRLNAK